MIYIVSQNFFRLHVRILATPKEYYIVDGDNYGVTGTGDRTTAISTEFNRAQNMGTLCPDTRLYDFLRLIKRGDEINRRKFTREMRDFLNDDTFIRGISDCIKILLMEYNKEPTNIFVVIPNLVWKYMGKEYVEAFRYHAGNSKYIRCLYNIDRNPKCLEDIIDNRELERLANISKSIDTEYSKTTIFGNRII